MAELKGAKVFLVVAETSFGGGDHVIRVVGMGGEVIDLYGNRVCGTLIYLALYIVAD